MIEEARMEDVGSGLAPTTDGWFVVNAGDAAWVRNEAFGGRCGFEATRRVIAQRPDLQPLHFDRTGFTLAVLEPGKPSGMYHAESSQEDFFVLQGECVMLIEEQERPLRQWDFVHLPPGTNHTFVGAGDGPCVIFMVGSRREGDTINYPESTLAQAHEAGVPHETPDPHAAYAPFGHWQVGHPPSWPNLPWAE